MKGHKSVNVTYKGETPTKIQSASGKEESKVEGVITKVVGGGRGGNMF